MTGPISLAQANFGHLVGKLVCVRVEDVVLINTIAQQRAAGLDKTRHTTISNHLTFQHHDPSGQTRFLNKFDDYSYGDLLGLVVEIGTTKDYYGDLGYNNGPTRLQEPVALVLREEHFVLAFASYLRPL